jgi:hypothetical protein
MTEPAQNGQPAPTPQPADPGQPAASPAEVAAAQRVLKKVRKQIARFHNVRRRNNEVAAGLRQGAVMPDQARQIIAMNRDPDKEREAVDKLRQLIGIVLGREPTAEEMRQGVPEGFEASLGMGLWPQVVAVGVASTAAGVYSVFNYLTTREETIQLQTATPTERLMNAAANNVWAIAAVGAVGLGALMYYRGKHAGEEEAKEQSSFSKLAAKITGGKGGPIENPSAGLKVWMDELTPEQKRKLAKILADEPDEDVEEEEAEEEYDGSEGEASEEETAADDESADNEAADEEEEEEE